MKRPRLPTLLVLLVCGALLLWRHWPWHVARDPDAANEAVFARLAEPLDFSVEGLSPANALRQFSEQTGLQVVTDEMCLGNVWSWDVFGDPRTVKTLPGAIAVSHLAESQRFVERLIETLTASERGASPGPWVSITHPPSKALLELQQKLQTKVSVDFDQIPLCQALDYLAQRSIRCRCLSTDVALEAIGLDLTRPPGSNDHPEITLHLKDVKLSTVFRWTLHRANLASQIRDEVLFVTTPEQAERLVDCRVYDVERLLRQCQVDPDTLIELITTIVAPDTWSDVGGPFDLTVCGQGLIVPATPGSADAGGRFAVTTPPDVQSANLAG